MARKGLTDEIKRDPATIRVQLPKCITGRTLQTILQSLANGIKATHMDIPVRQLKIEKETREIVIRFREAGNESTGD